MFKTQLKKVVTAAAAVALLAPALVLAGPGRGPHHRGDGFGFHRAFHQLDLSEAQKEQIHQLMSAHRESSEREQLYEARKALGEAIHAEIFDEPAIRTAAQTLAQLEADQAVSRAQLFQEIRKVLTPEQLEKLGTLREERAERWHHRKGRHGGEAGGPFGD